MEEKLLKYYSISPFLFDKEKCDKYTISQIIKILHNAQYNGFLFVYNEKKWYDHIIDFIKYLKELDKNEQEKRGISKVLLNNLEMEIHYKNKNLLKYYNDNYKLDFSFTNEYSEENNLPHEFESILRSELKKYDR